ncbi:hypothetical protein P4S72_17065 [Vibrio sp. PP-XX7]
MEVCRANNRVCFFQAMGLINDHEEGCVMREKVAQARACFQRPGKS